jgi:hypothetical protein
MITICDTMGDRYSLAGRICGFLKAVEEEGVEPQLVLLDLCAFTRIYIVLSVFQAQVAVVLLPRRPRLLSQHTAHRS